MLKKIFKGVPQELKDRWKSRFQSIWRKMSRGADESRHLHTVSQKDQWRREDKHQNSHDKHPHKFHKYK